MRREALAGLDAVVVDDAERAEAHVARVAVIAERKRMPAVEPVEARAPALAGAADGDHDSLLYLRLSPPCLTNVPLPNSSNAVSSSACVFMTTGPYHAIGSRSGLPATSRKRTDFLSALASTVSPDP